MLSFKKSYKRFLLIPIFLGGIILLLFVVLMNINPGVPQGDLRRQTDIANIQLHLAVYYEEYSIFPTSLEELALSYYDPTTKLPYEYQQLQQGKDYKLCVNFEHRPYQCFSKSDFAR